MNLYEEMMRIIDLIIYSKGSEEEIKKAATKIDELWMNATDSELQSFACSVSEKNNSFEYKKILEMAREVKKETSLQRKEDCHVRTKIQKGDGL